MRAVHPRRSTPRSLSWLLWLVLLLPLAQGLALAHGYGHGAAPALSATHAPGGDSQNADTSLCGLCLAAAHLGSGALPTAAAPLPAPASWQHWAPAAAGDIWPAQPPTAYLSRAPPLVSC